MEPADAADVIRDTLEERDAVAHARQSQHVDGFRRRVALLVAGLAGLLAITSLGGQNATKTMINANIQASDTYSFYQAKTIRQTSNQLFADNLQSLLDTTNPSDSARAAIQARIDRAKATVARYESEPQTGEGKKELLARAETYVQEREHAARQDPDFDYAEVLLQIAIVLGSVAILAVSRPVTVIALALGGVAGILMLNGFFLWFTLPIG